MTSLLLGIIAVLVFLLGLAIRALVKKNERMGKLAHALYSDGFAMRAAEIHLELFSDVCSRDVREELLHRIEVTHQLLGDPT